MYGLVVAEKFAFLSSRSVTKSKVCKFVVRAVHTCIAQLGGNSSWRFIYLFGRNVFGGRLKSFMSILLT